ncbi:MAG: RagB/SusD family nutrient uptake outer membrane protein [Paludibacter sp.]|nr:RagB/SusD family nutrient uptake outer membrane protein [Paludibacter sp.]MDD4428094.1 RagB/SusD family nutrient uptake outer membrane protein [Paludibacter sp.]
MKTFNIISLYVVSLLLLVGCNDNFLERYPTDKLSPQTYFQNENDFRVYTNGFYIMLPTGADIYQTERADNIVSNTQVSEVWGTRLVPTTDSNWDWSDLRKINFLLTNENAINFSNTTIRNKYFGMAKFFRALFYFEKVKRYGDVPWYSVVIESNDTKNLMKPRDSRVLVVDSILADLDFAIAYLSEEKNIELINKWTALALKSRVCLYEGTFRKYHTALNLPDATKLLTEAADAANEIMISNKFSIYNKTTGPSGKPYQDLFASLNANDVAEEVILTRRYSFELNIKHGVQFYLISKTSGRPGLEKRLVNSYLMNDGTPFTNIAGYDTLAFYDEMKNRDPRLAQTIRTPGYKRIGDSRALAPDFSATMTGYQIIKYLNIPKYDGPTQSFQDIHIFRYGEVLLNYTEAKAELETLTQDDINKSIKLLRDRVGMPNLNMAVANANPDPYQSNLYRNVSGTNKGVILEIRRERRIELVMEGNNRWDDIMRWKEGQILVEDFKGLYFRGEGEYDLDKNGTTDVVIYTGENPPPTTSDNIFYLPLNSLSGNGKGNYLPHKGSVKVFDEVKDYLYPLPVEDRVLNPNLTQNPGWPLQ